MKWPWVSRRELETALERVRQLEAASATEKEIALTALQRMAGAIEERKLLTDRIVEMAGMRQIYRNIPEPEAPRTGVLVEVPKREEKSGPVPLARVRVTADEMHAKFREAVRTGDVDANTVRAY